MRALSLPGCACRGAFQFAVMARLAAAGERFDIVAGASSGSLGGAAWVAGMAERAPDIARGLSATPIVSTRYLETERSIFGMAAILRDILRRHLPEDRLHGTESELLVATTHAGRWARGMIAQKADAIGRGDGAIGRAARAIAREARGPSDQGLVVHSNRERTDIHDVILASCYIPLVHAGLARLDGALHFDGAFADNTLIDALVARGAKEITVVTPFAGGAVARTMFSTEGELSAPPDVRLRIIYPERPLSIGRFDFAPERVEEAITMPHVERVIEPGDERPRERGSGLPRAGGPE